MAKYKRIPMTVEAVPVPSIPIDKGPFKDWPENPEWLVRQIDLGNVQPIGDPDNLEWQFLVGTVHQMSAVSSGDWIVYFPSDELRGCTGEIFPQIYTDNDKADDILKERYDQETLTKVYVAIQKAGLSAKQGIGLVHLLQNEGILFRERA